jgi:hypothetical protein
MPCPDAYTDAGPRCGTPAIVFVIQRSVTRSTASFSFAFGGATGASKSASYRCGGARESRRRGYAADSTSLDTSRWRNSKQSNRTR